MYSQVLDQIERTIIKSQQQPDFVNGQLAELVFTMARKLIENLDLEYQKGPVYAHYMLNHELEVLFQE